MKPIRKLLYLLLALALLLPLASCGKKEEATPPDSSAESKAAIAAYEAKDYKGAFEAAAKAADLSEKNRVIIERAYLQNCFINDGGRFYEAAKIFSDLDWPAADKEEYLLSYGALGITKKGDVIPFGTLDMHPVEWVVLDIAEEEVGGKKHAVAFLLTKYVVGAPAGWGNKTLEYEKSDLALWCEVNFLMQLQENLDDAAKRSITKTLIETDAGSYRATCFALSKKEFETYLVGDLKQYRKAAPTQEAELRGIKGEYASYYLRDLGDGDEDVQFVCGVNKDGEIGTRYGRSIRSVGGRACIRLDLGEIS